MFRIYGDEGYDDEHRVFTLAAFLAHEDDWATLSDHWAARLKDDGISCYHATDCAGEWGEFEKLGRDGCIKLNSDLLDLMVPAKLVGFTVSTSWADFTELISSSPEAKATLGANPYFITMRYLLLRICEEIPNMLSGLRVSNLPLVFDQNKEVSGEAKQTYDRFLKGNPKASGCFGSFTYESKAKFIPLQVVDELAFESNKSALNCLVGRRERTPIKRMRDALMLRCVDDLKREGLEATVRDLTGKTVQ